VAPSPLELLIAEHDLAPFACGRPGARGAFDQAAAFWRRRGFFPSKDDPLVLFRSIPDIAASLAAAGLLPPSS